MAGARIVRCACGQEMRVPAEALNRYGKCVACASRIKVTEYNSRIEGDAGEESAPVNHETGTCARCGKAFQGAWDRILTPQGTYCLRCGRQPDVMDLPVSTEPAASPDAGAVPPIATARFSVIGPEKRTKKPPSVREVVLFSVIALAALLIVLLLPVEEYAADFFSRPQTVAMEHLALWQKLLVWAGDILSGVAGYACIIAMGLFLCGRLPSEEWTENVLAISAAAGMVYLVSFAPLMFLTPVAQYMLLCWLFDLDILHVPMFFIAGLLGSFVQEFLDAIVMGTVTALFIG